MPNAQKLTVIPDGLARIIKPLLRNGLIERVEGKMTGDSRSAPEGTWARGGGIELPCKYKLYRQIKHKINVRKMLEKK